MARPYNLTPELYDLELAFEAASSFPFCHNFSLVALFPTPLITICHYKTHLQLVCVRARALFLSWLKMMLTCLVKSLSAGWRKCHQVLEQGHIFQLPTQVSPNPHPPQVPTSTISRPVPHLNLSFHTSFSSVHLFSLLFSFSV